jgi:hypothetical protein|tara:strand:- start:21 stop:365 length:345 start_codon:yes stop_codon:yes gene_type:complete
MSIIDTVTSIGRGVKDFFSSDTVTTIAKGAKTVLDYMKERSDDARAMGKLESLGNPNTRLGGQVPIRFARSTAKQPSFGDIQEASFYKYAQLQNTVRYLYSQKSRYKSIAKDRA